VHGIDTSWLMGIKHWSGRTTLYSLVLL